MSVAVAVRAETGLPADPDLFREEVLYALPYVGEDAAVTVDGCAVAVEVPAKPGYSLGRLQFDLISVAAAHVPHHPSGAFARFLCHRAACELSGRKLGFIVGVAEAAEILGVSKQAVSERVGRPNFPEPIGHPRAGPVWFRPLIEHFAAQRRNGKAAARG